MVNMLNITQDFALSEHLYTLTHNSTYTPTQIMFTVYLHTNIHNNSLDTAIKSRAKEASYITFYTNINLTNAAHYFKFYYVSGPRSMWCWCCYHLTNSRVRHVVVTDCRKLKYTAMAFSPISYCSHQISLKFSTGLRAKTGGRGALHSHVHTDPRVRMHAHTNKSKLSFTFK
jgi:hypothetical protein